MTGRGAPSAARGSPGVALAGVAPAGVAPAGVAATLPAAAGPRALFPDALFPEPAQQRFPGAGCRRLGLERFREREQRSAQGVRLRP